MTISPPARAQAQDLLNFIDASPSPWHAVATARQRLLDQGYSELEESERWQLAVGGKYFVVRAGASLIAFIVGTRLEQSGFCIIGAHTDSPGLRLKPKAAYSSDGMARLGVEVYGSPILATFTDRDLSLAGRVHLRHGDGPQSRLLKFAMPMLRLPNLAIHMNRDVNDKGLRLDKQNELPLLFGFAEDAAEANSRFLGMIADALDVAAADILSSEFNVFDIQPGTFWGAEQEFMADSQLDNLASCHAALSALLATQNPAATCVCAMFDHEEVGSESAAGAGGSFIADVLARISALQGLDHEAQRAALARSFAISADMAHAYHPNFPAAYEPQHKVMVNGGPVIKLNANQRYSTGADSAARFIRLCETAGVPYQQYVHRSDLGCGSTIGPIVAAKLGIASVDVGAPMWAMHSIRESAGVQDHSYMISVLREVFEQS